MSMHLSETDLPEKVYIIINSKTLNTVSVGIPS